MRAEGTARSKARGRKAGPGSGGRVRAVHCAGCKLEPSVSWVQIPAPSFAAPAGEKREAVRG